MSNALRRNLSGRDRKHSEYTQHKSIYKQLGTRTLLRLKQIRDGSLLLKIVLEHDGVVLGESKKIQINSNYEDISNEYIIEFSAKLPYNTQDMDSIRSIVSSPVISNEKHEKFKANL